MGKEEMGCVAVAAVIVMCIVVIISSIINIIQCSLKTYRISVGNSSWDYCDGYYYDGDDLTLTDCVVWWSDEDITYERASNVRIMPQE